MTAKISSRNLLRQAGLLDKEWTTAQGKITGEMLLAALTVIQRARTGLTGGEVGTAMGVQRPSGWKPGTWSPGSDRRTDRALALLKRAGLIRYDREAGRWRASR